MQVLNLIQHTSLSPTSLATQHSRCSPCRPKHTSKHLSGVLWGWLTLVLVTASSLIAQVSLDPFPDKLVVQRQAAQGDGDLMQQLGSRSFSGTYEGADETIEGRLIDADDGSPLGAWRVLQSEPSGGLWSGTLDGIPQGGWYRLEVRQAVSLHTAVSPTRFGVGEIILMLGQSNMARMFTEDAADGSPVLSNDSPHDRTWRLGYGEPSGYSYARPRHDDIPVSWGPVTGSGAIRLANRLQGELGVPVLLLDFALDWTGIDAHWNELDGPFPGWAKVVNALQQVESIGAVVWAQGAYDAINRPQISPEQYLDGLDTLYGRIEATTSGPAPDFGIVLLNRGDYTQNTQFDASFQAIRQAQLQWISERPEGFAAGSALDIDLSIRPEAGVGHFWATGYQLLADRMAVSLTDVLSGSTAGAPIDGGRLSAATLHGRHIRLEVTHQLGTRLQLHHANRDIDGFEVTQGPWGDADLAIERATLSSSQSGNHVVLTLAQTPTAPLRLRYLHGQNPHAEAGDVVQRRRRGNWLYDDRTYHPARKGLPIQPTTDDLTVAIGAAINLPPHPADDTVALGLGGIAEIDVLSNDRDPEGALEVASVVVLDAPTRGLVEVDPLTGLLTYRHDGSSHADRFTYAVADAQGLLSEAATVHIELLGSGLPPYGGRVLHVEANQGLEIDQGGRIVAWRDLSGTGNDLFGAGDAYRQSAVLNGQDCIELDGQGDKLERATDLRKLPGGNADRTLFTVLQYRDEGFGGFAYGSTTDGMGCADFGNRAFGLIVDPSGDLTVQGWCADFRSTTQGSHRGWLVQSAKVESNQLFHYSNGKLIDQRSHVFNTNANGTLVLGAELDSSPYLAMDVAAVLIYDRALSEEERMVVDSYLRQKYLGEEIQPPSSTDDLFQVVLGGVTALAPLANDHVSSVPLDPTSLTVLTQPRHGQVTIDPQDGSVSYQHDGSLTTSDAFTYTVADALGNLSEPATVQLSIALPEPELVTPGLILHLESDDGLVVDGDAEAGTEVLAWLDGSPAGHDVSTPSAGPRLQQGSLGDHVFLSFDGVNDQLGRAAGLSDLPGANDDRSVFLLVRYQGDGFGGVTWGSPRCNGVFGPGVDSRGFLAVQGWCFGYDVVTSQPGTGGWQLQTAVHGASRLQHYADGALLSDIEHTFDTDDNGRLALGYEIDGFPFVAMDLAAVLIYDRALDAADRLRVEGYLREKYLPAVPPGGDRPPTAREDLVDALPGQLSSLDVLRNDDDDLGLDPASLVLEQRPQHGLASVDPAHGVLRYLHDGSSHLTDSLTYRVADHTGQLSDPATVWITVGAPLPVTEGLVLRLEPQHGAWLDDGDHHLQVWLDTSGHGNDVLAAGRPRVDSVGPGGRPYLQLDGFDDHLQNLEELAGFPDAGQERTLITVVRYRSGGFGGVSYGATECNQTFGAVVDAAGELATQGWCLGNDIFTGSPAEAQGWLTHTALVDAGTLWQYRDGQLIDTAQHVFDTAAEGQLVIGAELDLSPHVAMDVAAVLLFDRALSESERLAVDDYLAVRYLGAEAPPTPLVSAPDVGHVAFGGVRQLDILANDRGDLESASVRIVEAPLHGSVTWDPLAGVAFYHHNGDRDAVQDRFTYTVDDRFGQVSPPTSVRLVALPSIDGLVLHLDSSLGPVTAEAGAADADVLVGWLDLADGANDLGATGAPRRSSTRNGSPAVSFDGEDDRLGNLFPLSGLPSGDDPRTVLLAVNYRSGGFGGVTWGSTDDGDCQRFGNRAFGTVVDFRGELAIQGWCFGNDQLSGVPGTGAGWIIQTTQAGGGQFEHRKDGVLVDGGFHTFATDGDGDLMVAAELDGSPSLDMELAAVLIFDRWLDDDERQELETHLSHRFIED